MDKYSTQQLLDLAIDAAKAAGDAILEIYDSGDYKSYEKADESPVTSADYRANEIITARLKDATPDIPIMSEESTLENLADRVHWPRYWLIDPIDGTQEFIARSGDFAVNIALIENNQPAIGVIYWPPGQSLYYASAGKGAFKRSPEGEQQIHVRKLDEPDDSVVIIAISRRQSRDKVLSRMNEERTYQTLPLGSCSLKSCFIAEGKADVFMRLGVTGEWDTGASQCIVSEAGGQILSATFEPLTYNLRKTLDNPDFVVLGDDRVNWRDVVQYR
ncbi:3'(2'),5'-bisphosphate nucleotidase CysQ [Alteromonas oceanisediminis]|uniref:3'(2'),5'-bisphosphate nucleotidase CysQ n=1 Tax=Alteromonas oceanisediminis TaxID=2836180 RepID=UPI001BD99213|nr:3'(2'),5'-bisphosphate nucleotidase CysQ [Alteromonas oceanisediminis]MBT0587866.1 3'(2'),5'-bisphosphate nucleotidase CysQ [Alteromonas oceanisediminis]